IYAAVRYPDEIVDTFRLPPGERDRLLDEWSDGYELGLDAGAIHEALNCGMPPEHYRAFIDAMRHDVRPRRFGTLDDLIDNYIYGSAIVVGYFLTYVYGAATPVDFERALGSARALGIAL